MSKLLSANFMRLKRDKIFYISLIMVFLCSLLIIIEGSSSFSEMDANGLEHSLDDFFFEIIPYMGAIYAVFICMFLGTEYSDGTIRNKIVTGHTRRDIFLANYFCCLSACLMITAGWLLGSVPGIFLIGMFQMSAGKLLACFGVVVGSAMVYTAIFTGLGMLSTNKAVTVVLALVLWTGLVLCGSGIIDRLNCPETLGGMAFIDGEFVKIPDDPNPLYLSGTLRTACEYIRDSLPSAQAILLNNNDVDNPLRQILLSLLVNGVFIAGGVGIYKRKDLK